MYGTVKQEVNTEEEEAALFDNTKVVQKLPEIKYMKIALPTHTNAF